MKIIQYKSEYFTYTVDLLKKTKNIVKTSSNIFDSIARLFENAYTNETELNQLFSKAYTILAVENEIPVGIASMDKDGIIGIFAVDEEKDISKISIRLVDKLNQKAMKKELEMLTVFPNDGKAKLFLDMNYETFDAASGEFGVEDKFMLVKRIKLEDEVEFFDEQGKKLTLNPAKKIRVEGTHSVFPFFFFGLACFFVFLFIIITATTYDPNEFTKSLAVFIGIGLIFW